MGSSFLTRCSLALALLQAPGMVVDGEAAPTAEVAGVKIRLVDHDGMAAFSAEAIEKHELKIDVDPRGEREPLTLDVELPSSGRNTWPAADVEVLDSKGRAMTVRRPGIEWDKLSISVPAVRGTYLVHAVDPPGAGARLPSEEERHATAPTTGLIATIAKWHDGRRAALSIRFDDSHPTHLSVAIPLLRQYGFKGTFMVNPGGPDPQNRRRRSAFHDHRAEWEACARRGDQEFANHSLHHRGALGDDAMQREIGDASQAIWDLFPGKSRLLALNLGGGTQWETTKTLRYYLDKYHLFDASAGSLGMDDVYGNRVDAFRRHLERHIERAGWCRIHFHDVGEGHGSSEANFRAALDVAKEHQSDLWIAGMADVYKYQTERLGARLALNSVGPRRAALALRCSADPALYDQPLTIDVKIPASWAPEPVAVTDSNAKAIDVRRLPASDGVVLRFCVPPTDAEYTIERALADGSP